MHGTGRDLSAEEANATCAPERVVLCHAANKVHILLSVTDGGVHADGVGPLSWDLPVLLWVGLNQDASPTPGTHASL